MKRYILTALFVVSLTGSLWAGNTDTVKSGNLSYDEILEYGYEVYLLDNSGIELIKQVRSGSLPMDTVFAKAVIFYTAYEDLGDRLIKRTTEDHPFMYSVIRLGDTADTLFKVIEAAAQRSPSVMELLMKALECYDNPADCLQAIIMGMLQKKKNNPGLLWSIPTKNELRPGAACALRTRGNIKASTLQSRHPSSIC